MLRHQLVLAAHVGAQDLGDGDGAVSLQVVLQEGDQHTRRGHAGVVQRVGQLGLAILILVADAQTACLGIAQVGAAANLKVLLLTRAPSLNVARFYFQVSHITTATI